MCCNLCEQFSYFAILNFYCYCTSDFEGRAINVVTAAGGSAVKLVNLLVQHFSRFRDTAIYKGQLVYFYKRAQVRRRKLTLRLHAKENY
jgi:Potential Queuosine, Q, salvage protein family